MIYDDSNDDDDGDGDNMISYLSIKNVREVLTGVSRHEVNKSAGRSGFQESV